MQVEVSPAVEGDLEEIASWIAQDNPDRAITFILEIGEAMRGVAEAPMHYQLWPEVGRGFRQTVVGRYLILFRVVSRGEAEIVRIERVIFGGRDLSVHLLKPSSRGPVMGPRRGYRCGGRELLAWAPAFQTA